MATRKPVAAKPAIRKTVATKVGLVSKAAGVTTVAEAMPRSGKLFGADPKRVVGKGSPALKVALGTIAKLPVSKTAATAKPTWRKRAASVLGVADKVTKLPPKAQAKLAVVKFSGAVIPITRKTGDSDENVPTLALSKVSDISKLLAKLPKGCFIGTMGGELRIYNKAGMLIVEVRTAR